MNSRPAADWQPLPGAPRISPGVLAELLDGGQAFRWQQMSGGHWRGQWSDQVVELQPDEQTGPRWRTPLPDRDAVRSALTRYLGLDNDDHDRALADLLARSDPHLHLTMTALPGLRILRQPFGETLLAFLCSATKQIVQIKQIQERLAARFGRPLFDSWGHALGNALPTWARLAEAAEEELRECQLGFRARYIQGTAAVIAAHPGWLEETAQMSCPAAKARLLALPGVGEKIADCVLLFGLGHLEAFPVDTWVTKAMARRYGLAGWSPAQIAHFGRVHFGQGAGLAQQYLFAWERTFGGR